MTTALMGIVRKWLPFMRPRMEISGDRRLREGMVALEDTWKETGECSEGDDWVEVHSGDLEHKFVDGLYVRKVVMPAGMLFTTKIHKVNHPYFMTKGKCRILTEEGVEDLEGPHHGITRAGTKRLMYIVEEMTWYTIHATKKKDPAAVEREVIAKDFSEFDIRDEDVKKLMGT